jgi:hypothetical protein
MAVAALLTLSAVAAGCAAKPGRGASEHEPEAPAGPEAPADAFAPPPPDAEVDEESENAPDDLARAQARLAAYEARLAAVGVRVGGRAPDPAQATVPDAGAIGDHGERAAKKRGRGPATRPERKDNSAPAEAEVRGGGGDLVQSRCVTVCELASAICELEGQICGMADRHPEDPRYLDACERATDDCRVASDACHTCSP